MSSGLRRSVKGIQFTPLKSLTRKTALKSIFVICVNLRETFVSKAVYISNFHLEFCILRFASLLCFRFRIRMKHSYSSVIALVLAALAVVLVDDACSMPHPTEGLPQCDPEYVQQVDSPKIRKICNFLQNYADAMKQFRAGSGDGKQRLLVAILSDFMQSWGTENKSARTFIGTANLEECTHFSFRCCKQFSN